MYVAGWQKKIRTAQAELRAALIADYKGLIDLRQLHGLVNFATY